MWSLRLYSLTDLTAQLIVNTVDPCAITDTVNWERGLDTEKHTCIDYILIIIFQKIISAYL